MENIKARAKRLLDCFNLTIEDWEKINEYQKGLCFVCWNPQTSGKRLATDHDHDSALIRGFLCSHCNSLLGKIENALKRNPAKLPILTALTRLIEYISSPPAPKALGREVYGYAGRVGTKKHRDHLRRVKKAAEKGQKLHV